MLRYVLFDIDWPNRSNDHMSDDSDDLDEYGLGGRGRDTSVSSSHVVKRSVLNTHRALVPPFAVYVRVFAPHGRDDITISMLDKAGTVG